MQNKLRGVGIEESAKSLEKLGYNADEIAVKLVDLGFDAKKAALEAEKLGESSLTLNKKLSNLKTKVMDTGKGIAQFFATNPAVLAGLATTVAIAGVAWATYSTSFDNFNNKAKESQASCKQISSELVTMQAEYENTSQRITELQSLADSGKISITEQQELDNLRIQNQLLEAQINLKQELLRNEQEKAASDARNALDYKVTESGFSGLDFNFDVTAGLPSTNPYQDMDFVDYVGIQQKRLRNLQEKYKTLSKEIEDMETAEGFDPSNLSQDYKDKVKEMESVDEQILAVSEKLVEDKVTLNSLYQSLFDSDGNLVYETDAELAAQIKEILGEEAVGEREKFEGEFKVELDGKSVREYKAEVEQLASDLAEGTDFTADQILEDTGYKNALDSYQKLITEIKGKASEDGAEIEDYLWNLSPDQLLDAYNVVGKYGIDTIEEIQNAIDSQAFTLNFDIEAEKSGLDAVTAAIESSYSATGLAATSVTELTNRYKDLEGFNAAGLFKNTASGIKINTEELDNLEDAYVNYNKLKLESQLIGLNNQYQAIQREIELYGETVERTTALNEISAEIADVTALAAEYGALTSSYNKWLKAKESGNAGTKYDNIRSGHAEMKEIYKQGGYGDSSFKEYLNMLLGESRIESAVGDGGFAGDYAKAWQSLDDNIANTQYSMQDFLKEGNTGVENFLKAVNQFDPSLAWEDKEGWHFEWDDEALAEEFGTTVEFIQSMLGKLEWYGFDVEYDNIEESFGQIVDKGKAAYDQLKEEGKIDLEFNFSNASFDEIESALAGAKSYVDSLVNEDGSLKVDVDQATYNQAVAMLEAIAAQKVMLEQPSFMKIESSQVKAEFQTMFADLVILQNKLNEVQTLEIAGTDTSGLKEAKQEAEELAAIFAQTYGGTLSATFGINLEEGADGATILSSLQSQIQANPIDAKIKIDPSGASDAVEDAVPKEQELTVNVTVVGKEAIDDVSNKITSLQGAQVNVTATGTQGAGYAELVSDIAAVEDKEVDVTANANGAGGVNNLRNAIKKVSGKSVTVSANTSTAISNVNNLKTALSGLDDVNITVSYVNGTAKAGGTANAGGTARANGNWGTAKGGKTLVGELGEEIVVDPYSGNWYTVGTTGAEFVDMPKDAIVFNHVQSKAILENGHINGRGKALASGTAMSSGSGSFGSSYTPSSGSGSAINSTTNSANQKTSEGIEKFDWIEVAIKQIEEFINRTITAATSGFKKLGDVVLNASGKASFTGGRVSSTLDEIALIDQKLGILNSASERYKTEAQYALDNVDKSVVPSAHAIAADIQAGAPIDISSYDETAREFITEYQGWWDKAVAAETDAIALQEDRAALYQDIFNITKSYFDNELDFVDHNISTLENEIDLLEERNQIGGISIYKDMAKEENNRLKMLQKEKEALTTAFNEAVSSGKIEEGSEAWYEMQSAINDVDEEIGQANISIQEINNSVRDIEWEAFDFVQDRIAGITNEADFLIDILSKSDLYDDKGNLTDAGLAVSSLHANNMNNYLQQAQMYGEERQRILQELANDPTNTELIEREQELFELQQDAILSAEEEKQARIDLAQEGINLELESLRELVDGYKESLDNAKNLYDYQQKIKDHTSEISVLRKQLYAYESMDDSEETRAKIQEIRANLEEAEQDLKDTEYDKYISDQKELLDNLYTEYETVLNERLDNEDALLSSIDEDIKNGSEAIKAEIGNIMTGTGYSIGFEDMMGSINAFISSLNGETGNATILAEATEVKGPFASGGLVDFTGLAQLDGSEQNPELVLNSVDTQNFLALRDTLRQMSASQITMASSNGVGEVSYSSAVSDVSALVSAIRSKATTDMSNNFGDINVTIPIEHVEDYNDFVNKLRDDPKFEKMIQAMTLGEILGKGNLSKNKYVW